MKTKNLNKHLFDKFGLNLTKECLEEIAKIVIEENSEPLVCKGEIKKYSHIAGEIFMFV